METRDIKLPPLKETNKLIYHFPDLCENRSPSPATGGRYKLVISIV